MATSPDDPNAAGMTAGGDTDEGQDQGGDQEGSGDVTVCITKHADGTFSVYEDTDNDEGEDGGQDEPNQQQANSVIEALHLAKQLLEGGAPSEDQANADMAAGYNSVRGGGLNGMTPPAGGMAGQ